MTIGPRMKASSRMPLVAAVLAVLSGAASAQSSLTLYGLLDLGVRHVKNGAASVDSVSSNGNNTSRLGVRGLEDLGGGWRAGFQLETGLTPDTGASSDTTRFWNRRSTLSLFGPFGELRVGRDYSVTYLGYEEYDVWSDIGLSSTGKFDASLGSGRDTAVRSDNQIVWFTPPLGGFYGRVGLAPGEGRAGRKQAAARAGFASGPLDVSASYGRTNVAAVAGDDSFATANLGAAYDFGLLKLTAYATHSSFADARVTNRYVGLQVPVGAQGLVRASYIVSDLSGRGADGARLDGDDAHQVALGYLHDLSRRTALYGNVVRVTNGGASAIAVERTPAPLAGQRSSGVELGLRHSF